MVERLSILFISVLLAISSVGQTPFYINYGVEDGLPSEEVYDIAIDESGLIWCTTDRGVCTYDGYEFTTYTTKDGLSNNTNFEIIEGKNGKLWFTGFNSELSYFQEDSFQPFENKSALEHQTEGSWVVDMIWNQNQLRFINFYHPDGFSILDINSGEFSGQIMENADLIYDSEEWGAFRIAKFDNQLLAHNDRLAFSKSIIELDKNQEFLGLFKNELLHFKDGQVLPLSDMGNKKADFILKDKFGDVWIGSNEGLMLYQSGDLSVDPLAYLEDISVTSIAIDRDDNYWISSLERGLFFIPSFQIKKAIIPTVQDLQGTYLFLKSMDEILFVGASENRSFSIHYDKEQGVNSWQIPSPIKFGDPIFFKIQNVLNYTVETPSGKLTNPTALDGFMLPIIWLPTDTLVYATFKGYIAHSGNKRIVKSIVSQPLGKERIKTWAKSSGDKIWAGTMEGLYSLSTSDFVTAYYYGNDHKLLSARISTIIPTEDDNLWIGSMGNGLLYFNMDTVIQFSEAHRLSSNMINSLQLQGDSVLWVATNKGLDKVVYHWEQELPVTDTIINYTTQNGLLSNYVNYVEWHQGKLWVAYNNGLNYFDPNDLERPAAAPKVSLTAVSSITDGQKIANNQELKHDQCDIVFSFKGISFAKPAKDPFYRYRLNGNQQSNDWYYSNDTTARFTNLAAGDYEFRVEAQNKHHEWSKNPVLFSFEIAPHFSKTWWFYVLTVCAAAFIIGWLWRWRLQDVKKDQKLKEAQYRTKDAELSVLRNQMNPHFVFNSLNSIQNYIFKNEIENANYYLSQFSKLMRSSIEFSKLEKISLDDEIQFLILYMDLELQRFPNTFDFKLSVDPKIATDIYYIPPLILQPIIENSVKYAFKHVKYKGLIEVVIEEYRSGELIQVIIQDNGSGIKENAIQKEVTGEQHRSYGLSIVKNRIELLNEEKQKGKASFQYHNRTDRSGLITTIILPIAIHNDKIRNS